MKPLKRCLLQVTLTIAVCLSALFSSSIDAKDTERPKPLPTLVIRGARVFDSERAELLDEQVIVVAGERITFVGAPSEAPEIPPGIPEIDGRGKFALPGLIDAHVHLVHVLDFAHVTGDEILPLFLAAGVTSVRSTGEEIVAATAVAHFAQSHPDRAPRVFSCSPLIDADPPIHRDIGRSVTDPAKVPDFVDEMVHWKVTTLKIYAGTQRPVGKAVIEEAHRRGLFVTAHLGPYRAQDAVADGIDGLEHIWSVFNYIIPPEIAATPGHRATLDLDNPLARELTADLARHGVLVDPTLAVFRNMILLNDLEEISQHPDNALVPKRLRDFWPRWTPKPSGPLELRRGEFAKYQELTGMLHRAGVPILAGTDAPEPNVPPGFSLHQELEMLVQSGLSPAAALQAATWNNARALKQQSNLGKITAERWADMILLDENPVADIRNSRTISLVIRAGRVVDPRSVLTLSPQD